VIRKFVSFPIAYNLGESHIFLMKNHGISSKNQHFNIEIITFIQIIS